MTPLAPALCAFQELPTVLPDGPLAPAGGVRQVVVPEDNAGSS